MLTSLLPGLREIRAPLAAGYLWLVAAWVGLHDNVTRHAADSHSLTALSALKDDVGAGAFAAALTFVAYLLGALWEPVGTWLAEAAWTAIRRKTPRSDRLPFEEEQRSKRFAALFFRIVTGRSPEFRAFLREWTNVRALGRNPNIPPPSSRISQSAWARLWATARRLFADIDEDLTRRLGVSAEEQAHAWRDFLKLRDLVHDALPQLPNFIDEPRARARVSRNLQLWIAQQKMHADYLHRPDTLEGEIKQMFEAEVLTPRDEWWTREASDVCRGIELPNQEVLWRDLEPLAVAKARGAPVVTVLEISDLVRRIVDELPLMVRRLPGEEQEQFLEVTRLKGEVEFRYALAVPLVVASSVIAAGLHFDWILATAISAVAGAGLLIDGWRRDRLRNDLLIELLAIGKARSPTFERLRERAQAVERRFSFRAIDEAQASEEAEADSGDGRVAEAIATTEPE